MFKKRKYSRAFTLVELLITIAVVSILFVVLVSRVDFSTDKARTTGAQNDMNAMQYAVRQVALEKGKIEDDLTLLAAMLNKNLDSELMVRVEGNMLKTYATDPWGNEYQLRYHKGVDNKGQVQIVSVGADAQYLTDDDLVLSIICTVTSNGTDVIVKNDLTMDEMIRDDGTIPNQPNIPGHSCSFNRTVQSSEFIHTAGNCAFEAIYYYSCSCGAKGTETFNGSKDLNTHVANPNIICTSYNDEQHTKITKCSGCRVELDTTYETHTFSNNTCTKCGHVQHTHTYTNRNATEANKATDATCSLPATYYYTCSCGAKDSQTFADGDELPHSYRYNVIRNATCTTPGEGTYVCSICGDTLVETIDIVSHNYNQEVENVKHLKTAATCKDYAVYYHSCICGATGKNTTFNGKTLSEHSGGISVDYEYLDENEHWIYSICNTCGKKIDDRTTTGEHQVNSSNQCYACGHNIQICEIGGKWQLNETLTAPSKNIEQYVMLTEPLLGNIVKLCINNNDGIVIIDCEDDGGYLYTSVYYDGWDIFAPVVDFGDEGQSVSRDFYNWFIANAEPYEEVELIGIWEFNEMLTPYIGYNVVISFESNGFKWTDIEFDYDFMTYCCYNGSDIGPDDNNEYYEFTGEKWGDPAYRLVNFGQTTQMVSKKFYTWLINNAMQVDVFVVPEGATLSRFNNLVKVYDDMEYYPEYDLEVFYAGDIITSLQIGDIISYNDYDYCYGYSPCCDNRFAHLCYYCDSRDECIVDGWSVAYRGPRASLVPDVEDGFFGIPVVSAKGLFYWTEAMETITVTPHLPDSILDMTDAFGLCENLITITNIPNNVINMRYAFHGCPKIESVPVIPESVVDMHGVFNSSFNINGTIVINANPTSYKDWLGDEYFDFDKVQLTLSGTSTMLDELGSACKNYCSKCNGTCTCDEATIISFTINNNVFYAEQGMNWEEWINSEYNIPTADGGFSKFYNSGEYLYCIGDLRDEEPEWFYWFLVYEYKSSEGDPDNNVSIDDSIVEGYAYSTY